MIKLTELLRTEQVKVVSVISDASVSHALLLNAIPSCFSWHVYQAQGLDQFNTSLSVITG